MKTFITTLAISVSAFFSTFSNAQTYNGTITPSVPAPGQTITINFALMNGSGTAQPNLVIYVYNSTTATYTALSTTTTFGGLGFYATYIVPSSTPNNATLQFAVGTNTNPPTFYGQVASATILPIIFGNYTATLLGADKVSVKWDLASTDGIDKTLIYRSTDGSTFSQIASIKGSASQNSYTYTDAIDPNGGGYFYKIVCVNLDGDQTTSNTMYVSKAGSNAAVSAPFILNNAHVGTQLFLSGIDLSNYKTGEVNIFDAVGRRYQATIQNSNTIATNNLRTGMYYLKIGANKPLNFLAQ